MNKHGTILIKDGYEIVTELVIFPDGKYAIQNGYEHYAMISKEQFDGIINKAKEQDYSIFDYTHF